ncbi:MULTISPECIES: hypothetical protein [unclassified Corynebacterium]|uniref:hypothetical protein n=2 Tax=Corynebacteriaceae TaxID=1653 RepID=UPI0025D24D77|nr:hypothetical protein [uncultured Corynebacterium sp.]WJY90046.1 hypothetical protein CCONF_07620 [Corynebacterium confusum]
MYMMVWILFLLGGLLLGGAWTAYQSGSRFWTIVAAALGGITTITALIWMIGEMQ